MTGSSKRKGDKGEREVVQAFEFHGFPAHRVPLSGAVKTAGGRYAGDVRVSISGTEWCGECKFYANGFKMDYGWLEEADMLFKRSNNNKWLVTMALEDLFTLLKDNET